MIEPHERSHPLRRDAICRIRLRDLRRGLARDRRLDAGGTKLLHDETLSARALRITRLCPRARKLSIVQQTRTAELRDDFIRDRRIELVPRESPLHLALAMGPSREHRNRDRKCLPPHIRRDRSVDLRLRDRRARPQPKPVGRIACNLGGDDPVDIDRYTAATLRHALDSGDDHYSGAASSSTIVAAGAWPLRLTTASVGTAPVTIRFSISRAMSGFWRRNSFAASRPWPRRSSP